MPPARRRCEIPTARPARLHAIEEATIRTPKQTLGTCAACARRTAGYIEKTKAIFSGRQREGDGPSRRLAFARRVHK